MGPIPIGRPIANTDLYVLDDGLQPVPAGVVGELYVGGVGLARGYLRRPDLTAERFMPHPFAAGAGERLYQTGDRVRLRSDGRLEYVGRRDEQVKVRGHRIELGEIETAMRDYPDLRDAAVAALGEGIDARLVAFAVPRDGSVPSGRDLRRFLTARLADYMVPAVITFVDELPIDPNGKLDRAALRDMQVTGRVGRASYAAPRSPIEETLCRIWEAVLTVERVGIHDDFFELGGHSLTGMQVVARIRDAFSAELPLSALFDAPTIAELTVAVVQRQAAQAHDGAIAALLAEVETLSDEQVQRALIDVRADARAEEPG
jgi:acyl carrier protein